MELGTPVDTINGRTAKLIRSVAGLYSGVVEDSRTKEDPALTFQLDKRVTNHDVAPSPMTVILIALGAIVVLVSKGVPPYVRIYLLCAAAGGFLVAGLISWNPYINRLLLGSLLLLAPVVGLGATVLLRTRIGAVRALLAVLLSLSVGWGIVVTLFNSTNRLVPPSWAPLSVGNRNLGYWNTSYNDLRLRVLTSDLEDPYKNISAAIASAGVSRVGVDVRTPLGWFPIYPLLTLLSDHEVRYVGDTLFPDKIGETLKPEVIVEIVPGDDFPEILGDGRSRGAGLLAPQHTEGHVLLLYYAR